MKKVTLRDEGDLGVDSKLSQACAQWLLCLLMGGDLGRSGAGGRMTLTVKEPTPSWVLEDGLQPPICKPLSAPPKLPHVLPHLPRAVL